MWKPRGCWASSARCCIPLQNITCKQQGFIHRPFSPSCPAVRDWISKSKYFFSPHSSPREPDPWLTVGRKEETSGRGKRPARRATQWERKESCRRGNPMSCLWNQRRGESCRGSPRGGESPLRKLNTSLAMVGEELPGRGTAERQRR